MNFKLVLVVEGGPKFLSRKEREKRVASVNIDNEKISMKFKDHSQDIYFNEMESIKNTRRGLVLTLKNKKLFGLTFYEPKKITFNPSSSVFKSLANLKRKLNELFDIIKKGINEQN